jgi:hypothetical protein
MMRMASSKRVKAYAWLRPDQVTPVRALAEAVHIDFVAAGSPVRGQSPRIAADLACESRDDLRAAVAECAADVFLILDPGEFGREPADLRALQAAAQRRVRVGCLEPIIASALELSAAQSLLGEGVTAGELARFIPLPRAGKVWRDCAEVLESFGPIRTAAIGCFGGTPCGDGSLGAQLFAALDWIHALMGEPETIDASFGSPSHAEGLHTLPGESLRGLCGDLTANLRFGGGRTACIAVSDQAGRFNRVATLLGKGGRLRAFDDGFEWLTTAGEKVDEHRSSKRGVSTDHGHNALVDAVKRLLDSGAADTPPTNLESVLAMAQATLLSARTGQSESPETIKRMTQSVGL